MPNQDKTRFLVALLAGLFLSALLRAQSIDESLPKAPIEIHLWGADLFVFVRPDAMPRVTARAVRFDPATGERVPAEGPTVTLRQQGPFWQILRAAPEPNVRLVVEVTLDPAQPLKIVGEGLGVRAEVSPVDAEELARLAEPASPELRPGMTLSLVDSSAELSGLFAASFEGRDSGLVTRESTGTLTLRLEGGKAEVGQHEGELRVEGTGSEVDAFAGSGRISYELTGGRLAVSASQGALEGRSTDARLVVDDFRGTLLVESSGGNLDLRSLRSAGRESEVKARGTAVVLEEWTNAKIRLGQEGGSLKADRCHAKVTLEASQNAQVRLAQVRGSWTANLREADVEVNDADRLEVKAASSRLEIGGAEHLVLRASVSDVNLSQIEELGLLILAESTANVQLEGGERSEIELLRATQATVTVPTPCYVRAVRGDGLHSSGCEVLTPVTFAPGSGVTVLTFSMDDDSVAEVVGY